MAEGQGHILVVDDDDSIRELLTDYLEEQGYKVTGAPTVGAMRQALTQATVDLVLLDLGLPDEDGLSAARALRQTSNMGIIIITGRGDTIDRVVGLELGADDYVTKPFELRELLARIRTVMRRLQPTPQTAKEEPKVAGGKNVAVFDNWRLEVGPRRLTDPSGQIVDLGSVEYKLLELFLARPNQVLDRDTLLFELYNRDWQPFDRAIDVQIGRLRKKIGDDVKVPGKVKTIRGSGYLFTPVVEWRDS